MKILVDINNKILKVLENDRSIFKGEQSADKLILYINQQLVNEYPVITGLLSNGRRIGPFTTDSSYGTETIDGTNYTTAEFTLSKENGFTLTEGTTEITIWIYKTKDTEVISKTAIGNVTFNVVNTTSFNDGDIIISGDVEGTVVNIKVELENLQSSVNAVNSRVNNLNGVVVKKTIEDISNNKTLQELYDEYGSCFVGKVGYNQRNVLFLFYKSTTQTNLTVCHGSNLKTYENVNMNLNVASLLDDSLGNPTYSNSYTDKEIDNLLENLGRSKVSIYTPSYSLTQGDEVVIRKKLTYDILTQPYTSSIIVAGGKYIAFLYIKGGPYKQVKLFDFISNAYYETSNIDTSTLIDYNTISFSTKSYYDKSKIDSLMSQKADKSTTYTKTEVDNKIWQVNDDMANNYMELESMIEESANEVTNELHDLTSRTYLIKEIGNATETLAGVMSAEDKKNLNTLVALLQDDENDVTDTIKEILAIFEQYPEGANLVSALSGKADKADTYSKAATDNLLAGKVDKTTYESKVGELEKNIRELDNTKIEVDSLLAKNNIKNYQEILWLGSDEIPEIPTQLPFGSSTDLITFLEGLKNLWSDIDSNLIEQYGYNRVVFLGLYGGKLVKVDIVKASSGNYNTRVHSSVYKANVKECISLNTNKRYKLINDTYETPQEPSYFLEEIPYLVYDYANDSVFIENIESNQGIEFGPGSIYTYAGNSTTYMDSNTISAYSDYGTGSFSPTSIYLEDLEYGKTFEVYLEDGYVSFGNYEDAYFKFTVHGVSGRDNEGNEYNITWTDLDNAGKEIYNYTEDGGLLQLNNTYFFIRPYNSSPIAEIAPEDGYIYLGDSEGNPLIGEIQITPNGISGCSSDGNGYYLLWDDIDANLGANFSEYRNVYDDGGTFLFQLTYCASSLDIIYIHITKAETGRTHTYLWEPGAEYVWDSETKEIVSDMLDSCNIGGLKDTKQGAYVPNDITFILGDYVAEGDKITIDYVQKEFSPFKSW